MKKNIVDYKIQFFELTKKIEELEKMLYNTLKSKVELNNVFKKLQIFYKQDRCPIL